MQENNYTWNYTYKGMAGKNDFIPKIIMLYSPQKDKSLSTSKEKIKNSGISSQPDPPKIGLKHTQSKPVNKIDFDKKKPFSIKINKFGFDKSNPISMKIW